MRLAALLFTVALTGATSASAQTSAEPQADAKPRLSVTEFIAQGTKPEEAQALNDAVVSYLSGRGLFEVLGPREAQTLLGAERQKQLIGGCESDALGCGLDLGKLVNSRFVLSGQLSKVGSAYQLTLQLIDVVKTGTAGRSTRIADSLGALRDLVPYAVSEATGSPLPPPPSRVLPITLLGVGGVAFLAGGVLEVLSLSREQQLNDELCPNGPVAGRCTGVSLRPRSFYVEQQSSLTVQKVIGLSTMAAGLVLVGLGVWLMPAEDARARISLRLVPTPGGFALAGGF